jgi:hypothetical protein
MDDDYSRYKKRYLAKSTLANGSMEVEMVEGNFTLKVDRLRETATNASHLSFLLQEEDEQGLRGQKYKALGFWNFNINGRSVPASPGRAYNYLIIINILFIIISKLYINLLN